MKEIVLWLLLLGPFAVIGQQKPLPIRISFFNEATAIPYTRFLTFPVHPGIQIGTETDYREGKHSRLFQTASLSYFYHNHLNQGLGINTELGYERTLKFGLKVSGLLGVGYMHTFATAEEFTFIDGHYVKKADKGNARFYPSFAIRLGYSTQKVADSPEFFVTYQSWAEIPYSPGFIPVMTHISLHIGARVFINRKRSGHE